MLPAAAVARGGPEQPLGTSWGGGFNGSGTNIVEQQSNFPYDSTAVVNNTGCIWDVNTWGDYGTSGYLNAGETFTQQECIVADPDPTYRTLNGTTAWWSSVHPYASAFVTSPSSALSVSVCWQPQGRCFTPAAVYNQAGRRFEWSVCAHAVYQGGPSPDPDVVEIPNSNGGHGVISTAYLSVTNTSGKRLRGMTTQEGATSDATASMGCTKPLTNPQFNYPFTWSVS